MIEQLKPIFECGVCTLKFKDETDLNAHTLFVHGAHRGYCENPNSVTHMPEETKLHDMLKNNFKIIKRFTGTYHQGAIEYEAFAIILRLEQLGQKFTQKDCPDEMDLYFLREHCEVKPFSLYQNLTQRTDELEKLDKEAANDVKMARGLI